MRYLIAYGTLRKGEYNFNKFPGLKFIDTVTVPLLKMYDLGPYPTVVITGNKNDVIKGDLLEVPEDVYSDIKHMELDAGYRERQTTIYINGKLILGYIFTMEALDKNYPVIESGDWLNQNKVIKRNILVVGESNGYANWMEGKIVKDIKEAELILFTGGEDVDPSLYNEKENYTTSSNLDRDLREKEVFEQAVKLGIPIVGICRGSQLGCVLSGGRLIQHMQHPYSHDIVITEGVEGIVDKDERLEATSTHHQMQFPFNLKNEDYRILAYNPDKSKMCLDGDNNEMNPPCDAEIVYYPKTKCLAIQMHPEALSMKSKTITYLRHLLDTIYGSNLKQIPKNTSEEVQA